MFAWPVARGPVEQFLILQGHEHNAGGLLGMPVHFARQVTWPVSKTEYHP